jgi:hypothetical protein
MRSFAPAGRGGETILYLDLHGVNKASHVDKKVLNVIMSFSVCGYLDVDTSKDSWDVKLMRVIQLT